MTTMLINYRLSRVEDDVKKLEEKLEKLREEIEYADKAKPEARLPSQAWINGYQKAGG